jgi:hypothetical protein
MTHILVYMQDGRVFTYEVENAIKAREHAHRIITEGWRNATSGKMEYYPVHQVLKVTFDDPKDYMSKKYEGEGRDLGNIKPNPKSRRGGE